MSSVSLNKEPRKLKNGQKVEYWYLRWYGPDGKRRAKCIGRCDELSKTKAHKIRLRKMADLEVHPGRDGDIDGPGLGAFVDHYLVSRQTEVSRSTVNIERTSAAYLLGYFGDRRRVGTISRPEARSFREALISGKLKNASQSPRPIGKPGADKHVRHIRTMFARLVDDEIIDSNPFRRIAKSPHYDRAWPYVDKKKFNRLMAACPDRDWRIFLGLCRLAALRRTESLSLGSERIRGKRLQVIADTQWRPKDRDARWIPICPELQKLLAEAPQGKLVGGLTNGKIKKQFPKILRKARVKPYEKPFQSMRKSCIRDWSMKHAAHVVRQWSGHASMDTMDKYYLQTPESEYDRASDEDSFPPQ